MSRFSISNGIVFGFFFALVFALPIVGQKTVGSIKTLPNDPRQVRDRDSPDWLAAVGRIEIETSPNTFKYSSITLVSFGKTQDSRIAVGAGHTYSDWFDAEEESLEERIIKKNTVTFATNAGKTIRTQVSAVLNVEFSGADGDFAILLLKDRIVKSDISPLIFDKKSFNYYLKKYPSAFASAAGYSADDRIGKNGTVLTYHARCNPKVRKYSTCYSYPGASGGPIVVSVIRDKAKGIEHLMVGIISEGDDYTETTFTPSTLYELRLRRNFYCDQKMFPCKYWGQPNRTQINEVETFFR